MAHLHYDELLQEDEVGRNVPKELTGVTVPTMNAFFADGHRKALARVVSGEAQEDEISALVGVYLEIFQSRGMLDAPKGSIKWRKLARLLAGVQIEARTRSLERDIGYYGGTPTFPPLNEARPADLRVEAVSLRALLTGHTGELQRSGRGGEAARRWKPCIEHLIGFLKHDDAQRLTRQDVFNWREELLTTLSPKTVRDAHMTGLKAILQWGVNSGRIKENVAKRVKVRVPARPQARERGLTNSEARAILYACRTYSPARHQESAHNRKRLHDGRETLDPMALRVFRRQSCRDRTASKGRRAAHRHCSAHEDHS